MTTLPTEIEEYFDGLQPDNALNPLIERILSVGDALNDARRKYDNIEDIIHYIDTTDLDFKLKHKTGDVSQSPIRRSKIRETLGIPEQEGPSVLSRDTIKIKMPGKKSGKMASKKTIKIKFDAAANYKDGNHNWGVHAHVKNKQGDITQAAIYLPETGQIYVADEQGAHYISFPQFRSASQEIKISKIEIGELGPKFNAEVGSWHTKERAFVKTLFTTLMRENIGGSLRETGMKEAPFAWVGLNRLGYSFIGNLKPKDGKTGAFIAEQAGAVVIRAPITSDSQGRDALFAVHPDIADAVLGKFNEAIKLSQNDVTIGTPTTVRNIDPALVKF